MARIKWRIMLGIALVLLASTWGWRSQAILAGETPSGTAVGATETVDLGNGVTLETVAIPGGSFLMGSPTSEKDRADNEGPQHQVTLEPFWMGKCEVTQAQWQALMGSNPSHFKGDNRPVEQVSLNDARAFCQKLATLTGKPYRLPSEAQWEYACRAGTTTRFFFGDSDGSLGDYAWFFGNSGSKTHPVGEKSPNPWGLHDICGNVLEWCEDMHHDSYMGAPNDGSAWTSGSDSTFRVLRGGWWRNGAKDCRSACRRFRHKPDFKDIMIGFRVVYPQLPPQGD